jgi:hypothetical protein
MRNCKATIIVLITDTPFARLQTLPTSRMQVIRWKDRDLNRFVLVIA